MFTLTVVLLALSMSVGVVGGAPAGVTPTTKTPPTRATSRDFSSGPYNPREDSGAEHRVSLDRENLCANADCTDATENSSGLDGQRPPQVSHGHLVLRTSNYSVDVPSQDTSNVTQREMDWLRDQDIDHSTTNSGLLTWSWLDVSEGKPTPEPTRKPNKNIDESFFEQYSSYVMQQIGASANKAAQAVGIAGSWTLPIRFSYNKSAEVDTNATVTPIPSASSSPETNEEGGSYAGHQWLTTGTVTKSDTLVTVTDVPDSLPTQPDERPLTPASRITPPTSVDEYTRRPVVSPPSINPPRHTAPTHTNTRRSTTSYTSAPLPITSMFTNIPVTTVPRTESLTTHSSTTSNPQSTTSPRTLTPRFTFYPRTRRPQPTKARNTSSTQEKNPALEAQPTAPPDQMLKAKENATVTHDDKAPESPSTIEELTFLLSDKYVKSEYATVTENKKNNPNDSVTIRDNSNLTFAPYHDRITETSVVQANSTVTPEEQPTFVTFSYVFESSHNSPELTTSSPPEEFSQYLSEESTNPTKLFTYFIQPLKGTEQPTKPTVRPLVTQSYILSQSPLLEQPSVTNGTSIYPEQATTTSKPDPKDTKPTDNFGLITEQQSMVPEEKLQGNDETNKGTEETPTEPERVLTSPMKDFTDHGQVSTPSFQLTTVDYQITNDDQPKENSEESSTSTFYYSNKYPGHGEMAPPSEIGQILGQLFDGKPQGGPVAAHPSLGETTVLSEVSTPAASAYTTSFQGLTTAYSEQAFNNGFTTSKEQAKYSPWTTPPTTSVTPKKNLLESLLNQTLIFLSNKNQGTSHKYSPLTLPPDFGTTKPPTERFPIPLPTVTAKPHYTVSQSVNVQLPNYFDDGTKLPLMPGAPLNVDIMESSVTTNSSLQGQNITCKDVLKFSPLLDFYASLYPGLVNPCNKALRTDHMSIPDMDLRNEQLDSYKDKMSGNNTFDSPSTTRPSVFTSNSSLGFLTYRIPKPVIVSSSYSTHALLAPSSLAPSTTEISTPTKDILHIITEENESSTETPVNSDQEVTTLVSVRTHPLSVFFPQRNSSYHIGTYPRIIATSAEPQSSPAPNEAIQENFGSTSAFPSTQPPNLWEDLSLPNLSFVSDGPIASLMSADGNSTIVNSPSFSSNFPLPQPSKEEGETKWVKISIEPSEIVPTPSPMNSTSKKLEVSSTTNKPTPDGSNSLHSITSIWGSWYNRWASSRSEAASTAPANDTLKDTNITTDPSSSSSSTIKPTSLLTTNHTTSYLETRPESEHSLTSPRVPSLSSDPTNIVAKSPSMTISPAVSESVLSTVTESDFVSSTTQTSTLYATSQTTPISVNSTVSPVITPVTKLTSPRTIKPQLPTNTTETHPPTLEVTSQSHLSAITHEATSSESPETEKDKQLSLPGEVKEVTGASQPNTTAETLATASKEPDTVSRNGSTTSSTTTSTPLTRVLGSLWDLFRKQPLISTITGGPENITHVKDGIEDNASLSKVNLMPSLKHTSTIMQEVDNSTVYNEGDAYEEKNRFLQLFSKRREPHGDSPQDTSIRLKNVTRSPTKSPSGSYLPSSIESLDNLFSLLGKFGKNSIFGSSSQTNEGEGGSSRQPNIEIQAPTRPPHYSNPIQGPVVVTYWPSSAQHRHNQPDPRMSTQRPAIILRKQGSRVHVPLIPSADFSSFQPYSSLPSKTFFRPRVEVASGDAFIRSDVPLRPTDTLPPNIIRSRVSELDYGRPNDAKNDQTKTRPDSLEQQRPPVQLPPMGTNTLRQKRCGKHLRDRLDYLLGRELVMDQFGVRVYSSVVESILTAECNTPQEPNRGPLPVPSSTPPSSLMLPTFSASVYKPAATFGMEGWLTLDDLRAKAEEERLLKHKENIPLEEREEDPDTSLEPTSSYGELIKNHRLTDPFVPTAVPLSATPWHPTPTDTTVPPQISPETEFVLGSTESLDITTFPPPSSSSTSSPISSPLLSSVPKGEVESLSHSGSVLSPSSSRAMAKTSSFTSMNDSPSSFEEMDSIASPSELPSLTEQIPFTDIPVATPSDASGLSNSNFTSTFTPPTLSTPSSSTPSTLSTPSTSTPPTLSTPSTSTPFTLSTPSTSTPPTSSTLSTSPSPLSLSTTTVPPDSTQSSLSSTDHSSTSSAQSTILTSTTHPTLSIPSTVPTLPDSSKVFTPSTSSSEFISSTLPLPTETSSSTSPSSFSSFITPSSSSSSTITPPPESSSGSRSVSRRFARMLRNPQEMALGAGMLALNNVALAAGSPIGPSEETSFSLEEPLPRALSTTVFGFETILTGLVYLSFGIFLYQMIQRAVDAKVLGSLTSIPTGRSIDYFDTESLMRTLEEGPELASELMLVGMNGAEVWAQRPSCLALYLCRVNSPDLQKERQPAVAVASSVVSLWAGLRDPKALVDGSLATWKGAYGYSCDYAKSQCQTDLDPNHLFRHTTLNV